MSRFVVAGLACIVLCLLTPVSSFAGVVSVPEIDPAAAAGGLALVTTGAALVIERRRRR